jgi:hypothetical protein
MAGLAPISVASIVIGFISFAITLLTLAGMHLLPFDIPPAGCFVSLSRYYVVFELGLRTLFAHGEEDQCLVVTVVRTRVKEQQSVFHLPPRSGKMGPRHPILFLSIHTPFPGTILL